MSTFIPMSFFSNRLSLAGPSIGPLPEPEKPDLGGSDTHRHCFATWYITLQNHTGGRPFLPPIFPIFGHFGRYPPPDFLFSLRLQIATSQLPGWLS
jgi:hypothetical protein